MAMTVLLIGLSGFDFSDFIYLWIYVYLMPLGIKEQLKYKSLL